MTTMQNTAADALLARVQPTAHHMTIKAAYRALTGRTHESDGLTIEQVRAALTTAAMRAERAEERKADRRVKAPREVKLQTVADLTRAGGRFGKVVAITRHGLKGQAARVRIRCQLEGCEATREVATQDLFQVSYCCTAHKRQAERVARERRADLKAA